MAKSKIFGNLLERLVPVLLLASIILAFVIGVLWQRVSNLEKGGTGKVAGAQNPTITGTPNQGFVQGKLSSDQVKNIPPVSDSEHIRGTKDAKITVIEYSDFQCPFCKQFHPTMEQVMKDYDGKVRWVYRHFPLDQLHPNARPAAEASECITSLGGDTAFWKFADEVFADQTGSLSDIAATAVKAGVDKASFQSCYSAKKFASKVEDSYQAGLKAGITGTPGSFILNDKGDAWLVPGALPYDSIKSMIDEAIKG